MATRLRAGLHLTAFCFLFTDLAHAQSVTLVIMKAEVDMAAGRVTLTGENLMGLNGNTVPNVYLGTTLLPLVAPITTTSVTALLPNALTPGTYRVLIHVPTNGLAIFNGQVSIAIPAIGPKGQTGNPGATGYDGPAGPSGAAGNPGSAGPAAADRKARPATTA